LQSAGNDDVLNFCGAVEILRHFRCGQMAGEGKFLFQTVGAHGLHTGVEAAEGRPGCEFFRVRCGLNRVAALINEAGSVS